MRNALIGYDPASGAIISQVVGEIEPAQVATLKARGLAAIIIPNAISLFSQYEYYILNGKITGRPASPVSRTGLTLHDVPTGSKLYINGESYDAADTVELEFPLPGAFRLRVECFPYLDWDDEVAV